MNSSLDNSPLGPVRTAPLDTRIEIVTPENIAFEYRVAGPFRRLPAFIFDMIVQLATMLGLVIGLQFLASYFGAPGVAFGVLLALWFCISWFYGGLFEALWNGQTPGKRLMRLRVLSIDGQPINGQQAVLRNLLRNVDMLPLAPPYLLGLVVAMLTARFQRLGDIACGTMVVVEEPQHLGGLVQVVEPEAMKLAQQLPANLQVSPGLARALSSYVARRRLLPWGRRIEIARHVAEPLRVRYGLPVGTSYDALLCAVYHQVFLAEQATL